MISCWDSYVWAPGGGRVAGGPGGTLKGKVRFYAADDNGRLEYEAQVSASQSGVFFHRAN